MDRYFVAAVIVVALSLVATSLVYSQLPASIAIHWNASGQADGFGGREHAFAVPLISALLLALLFILPRVDPFKKNYPAFVTQYGVLALAITLFLAYTHGLMLATNLGVVANSVPFIVAGIGVLFMVAGWAMAASRRNWFFGFRTPWSLSSDEAWRATNELGGKLFAATGVATLVAVVAVPSAAVFVMLGLTIATAIATTIYSYWFYSNQGRAKTAVPKGLRKR